MKLRKMGVSAITFLSIISTNFLSILFYPQHLLAQTSKDKSEADSLLNPCRKDLDDKKYQAALESCQKALDVYTNTKNRPGEAKALNNLGLAYYWIDNYDKAIEFYQQSLVISREIQNRQLEAKTLSNLAESLFQKGVKQNGNSQFTDAKQSFQHALKIYQQTGDQSGEAKTLLNLGITYVSLQDLILGINSFKQSLAIGQKIKDPVLEKVAKQALSIFEGRNPKDTATIALLLRFMLQGDSNPEKTQADKLFTKCLQQYENNQLQEALQSCQQALRIFQKIGDYTNQGKILNNMGVIEKNLGNYAQSLTYLKQALSIAKNYNDVIQKGLAIYNIAEVYLAQDKYPEALEIYQQSLSVGKESKNKELQASVFNSMGEVYRRTGKYKQAIESYTEALNIVKDIKHRSLEGMILNNLGLVSVTLGKYQESLQLHLAALDIATKLGNPVEKSKSLRNIGAIYRDQGKYEKSLDYLQQALLISQQNHYNFLTGLILKDRGYLYSSQRLYKNAFDDFEQALVIAKKTDDKKLEVDILIGLGIIYDETNKYQQAIDLYNKALEIVSKFGNKNTDADVKNLKISILNNLGLLYITIGQDEKVSQIYTNLLNELPDNPAKSKSLAITLVNIGMWFKNVGENIALLELDQTIVSISSKEVFNLAMKAYEEALSIFTANDDPSGEGRTLNNIGNLYLVQNQYQQALTYYQKALDISKNIKEDQVLKSSIINNIGWVYEKQSQYQKALEFYQQALTITKNINNRYSEANTLNNTGRALLKIGKLKEAETILRDAMEIQESLRPELKKDEDKISFIDTTAYIYRNLQEVLIDQGKITEALEISEKGRARTFVELLNKKLSFQTQDLPAITTPIFKQIQQIAQEQKATLVEYSLMPSEIYIWVVKPTGEVAFYHQKLNPLIQNDSLRVVVNNNRESITKNVNIALAKPSRGVSQQLILKKGDRIRFEHEPINSEAWEVIEVNTQTGKIKIRLPSQPPGNDEGLISEVAEIIDTNTGSANKKLDSLQKLHQILIEPIADLLPSDPNARVIFIPQGELFSVPFPALQDANGKYLIEKHTILTAPSIQVLQLTREQKQRLSGTAKDVLVVGNPIMPKVALKIGEPATQLAPLPEAEKEAQAIAPLFYTKPIIGKEATKAAILPLLPKAKIIHLATHGLLDDRRGLGSAIALAPSGNDSGLLTAEEILDFKQKLNAELVILSACDTGQGRITGDGVIGLSRSLIAAGVPSVIVTLWSIPDAPTAPLMTEFYRQMQQKPDKAQALRQAMLTTMKTHPNPSDWAAFTLIGEAE